MSDEIPTQLREEGTVAPTPAVEEVPVQLQEEAPVEVAPEVPAEVPAEEPVPETPATEVATPGAEDLEA